MSKCDKTCTALMVGIGYPHIIDKNKKIKFEKSETSKHDLAACKYAVHKEVKTKQGLSVLTEY